MTIRNQAGRSGAGQSGRLDRFLGDALIGAMVLLGLVFCAGAVRAETNRMESQYHSSINAHYPNVDSMSCD